MKIYCRHKAYFFGLVVLISLVFVGCKQPPKEDPEPELPQTAVKYGLYVLNEGGFHLNNSSLAFIDLEEKKVHKDYFLKKNGRQLGDTGNDMLKYGNKIYISVTTSSTLEVIDAKTAISLAHLDLKTPDLSARQPRRLIAHGNNVYLTTFDGYVLVIDTLNLSIQHEIKVGRNPEGMAIQNNKLYVANSGGLDAPNYDNTVSVIDLATHIETKKIEVAVNLGGMFSDKYGQVYVVSRGNYSDIPARLYRIDTSNDQVYNDFDFSVSGFCTTDTDSIYLFYTHWSNNTIQQKILNTSNRSVSDTQLLDKVPFVTYYGIQYLPEIKNFVVYEANQYVAEGMVYLLDHQGNIQSAHYTGIIPSKSVLITNP